MKMTIIDTDIEIARHKEIMREAIAQTSQERAEGTDRVCEYPYGWGCAEGDVIYSENIISSADRKHNNILFSVAFVMIFTITPIAGCIMWFTSVRLWINLTILALAGIVCEVFIKLDKPRESSEEKGIAIVTNILECMCGVFVFPIITAIIVVTIEGILWIGALLF